MLVSKFSPSKTLEIWTPRYHDDTVLINASHLDKKIPHYKIIFTKAKHLMGAEYYLSYRTVTKSRKEHHKAVNGKDILRYIVPMSKLQDYITDNSGKDFMW